MWPLWRAGIILGVVCCCSVVPAWGQQWQDIAGALMSPACPGRTLVNCTSSQAEQWRELIRQKLAAGEKEEQILQYFVEMNGEGVLAAPPKKGFALTAWLLPIFLLLNGAGLIVVLTRKWARQRPAELPFATQSTPSPADASDPYVARLRSELKEFDA